MLESIGVQTRTMTSINMPSVAEPYIRRRALRHLEKGRVVIFGGGTGNPYFSTDTTSALRGAEIGADAILMAKNGTDAVYTADPNKDPSAEKISEITASEVLEKNLTFADPAAISLARENNLELKVIGMEDISKLKDENIGTKVLAK